MRYYNPTTKIYLTDAIKSLNTPQGLVTNPLAEHFLSAGYLPVTEPVLDRFDKRGALVVSTDSVTYEVILATPDEKRVALNAEVYQKAMALINAVTADYSPAEMGQWPTMIQHAEAGDWAYFDAMATPSMTGQEYGTIVLTKSSSLKGYFDAVVLARNTHKVAIAGAADADLDSYDTEGLWP